MGLRDTAVAEAGTAEDDTAVETDAVAAGTDQGISFKRKESLLRFFIFSINFFCLCKKPFFG